MKRIVAALLLGCGIAGATEPPAEAVWNADHTAAATSDASGVFAYIRQKDGSFLKVDLTQVEVGNLGKLGSKRTEYDRLETKPLAWAVRPDELLQLTVQTQAWKAGKRFTVSEPLLIRRDGTVLWR